MIVRLLGHVNGLTILILGGLGVLAVAGGYAVMRVLRWEEDRPEGRHQLPAEDRDTLAWARSLRPVIWVREGRRRAPLTALWLRAQIGVLGTLIQASTTSPAGSSTATLPPSAAASGADPRPGDEAAAGSACAPPAFPPLPPDDDYDDVCPDCGSEPGTMCGAPSGELCRWRRDDDLPPDDPWEPTEAEEAYMAEHHPAAMLTVGPPPDLPPDDLGPECSYSDWAPWPGDDTLIRGFPQRALREYIAEMEGA